MAELCTVHMVNDLWGHELFNRVMHMLGTTSKQMKSLDGRKCSSFEWHALYAALSENNRTFSSQKLSFPVVIVSSEDVN